MHLIVENGLRAGESVELVPGQTLTIGSDPDSGLRLADPGVSPQHAVVKPLKNGGFGIKADGGTVRLDGDDVPAARLGEGSALELGPIRLGVSTAVPEVQMLGGYKLLGQLGKGGMGEVFRAKQVSLDREVALKVLSHELTQDPMFIGHFVAEARAAARLHHPNVVQVFDVDHEGDTYFYPMELMEESLESVIQREGKLDAERVVSLIDDAAAGLAYAESLRIVHRDIKPDNIMLDRHGTAKLCDLGLAQTDEGQQEGKVRGTPHFMAPEQALRKPIDNRTDLYALGCTFYRMLTGRTPFQGKTVKEILKGHVKTEPDAPHKVESSVPTEISAIVLKLLEKDPEDRFQTAEELREALAEAMAPPAKRGLVFAALGLAIVAGGVAVWYASQDKSPVVISKNNTEKEKRLEAEAQKARAEQREMKAENARLRVMGSGASGIALAEQLEALAKAQEYADTKAATTAKQRAGEVRQQVAAAEAAAAARASEIRSAVDGLSERTRDAIGKQQWQKALDELALAGVPEDLRTMSEVIEAGAGLRGELVTAAKGAAQKLADAVAAARTAKDPAAMGTAADALEKILEGEGAWPAELLANAAAMGVSVKETRAEILGLEQAAVAAELAGAWGTFDAKVAKSGPRPIDDLDFVTLAAVGAELADGLGERPPGVRAGMLADAARRAEACLSAFEQSLGGEESRLYPLPDGTLAPIARLTRAGDGAGFTVLVGPRSRQREERIARSKVDLDVWTQLTGTAYATSKWDALALHSFLVIGDVARRGQAWLQTVDAKNDDSGTGPNGFRMDLQSVDTVLRGLNEEGAPSWAKAMAEEVQAARTLAAGFTALSERRNRAGATHIRNALQHYPHSVVVLILP